MSSQVDILDDPEEWDRWMSLTEDEMNKELDIAFVEYKKFLDRMTFKQKNSYYISKALERALKWRSLLTTMDIPLFKSYLRQTQIRLLKLRIERQTGVYPGQA